MTRYSYEDEDHVASDDLDAVLEYTRQIHESSKNGASSSKRSENANGELYGRENAQIRARIAELDSEVRSCQQDIAMIKNRMAVFVEEKNKLEQQLEQSRSSSKGKAKAQGGINYSTELFDWSDGLKARMKAVFNIDEFRLCQKGACNANMDGRDIVCIMPTGGGKSLTYQLPALLTAGCTLVISPLISLMTDQILHLKEANVEAAMITSGTPKQEKNMLLDKLRKMADQKLKAQDEIKLFYVTPEKMSKDKYFRSLLQRMDEAGKLARVVIDEAHCVSQLGHDFRPDYKELHILRKIFPRVPIMALSATCGPEVLKDLIKILGLSDPVDGNNASAMGTVYFSSPLYRKNLHYRVVPKANSSIGLLEDMKNYILEHHPNDTGIIYCFTVKDTIAVAEKLREISNGKIKTGVYNAKVPDAEKIQLHLDWRQGKIKVVCATIAFGLGIDKGDVRFVLHHSISKSLEGFYQESGRAGRDGKDSDCVLYYRPQDASSIGGVVASEKEGQRKLHAMLSFAEEIRRCRKVAFAEYFSHSSQLSITSFSTEETGALEPCGHCDNCQRPDDSFERRDVTLAAWQIVKVVNAVKRAGGRVTLGMVADLVRGAKKGAFDVSIGRKKQNQNIDLAAIAGGPIDLTKPDIEHLLVHLLTKDYLKEEYVQTSYTCTVYIVPGGMSYRILHLAREDIVGNPPVKLEYYFLKKDVKKRVKKSEGAGKVSVPRKRRSTGSAKGKGKDGESDSDLNEESDDDISTDGIECSVVESSGKTGKAGPSKAATKTVDSDDMYASDSQDDESVVYDWSYSMRDEPRPKRRRKVGPANSGDSGGFTMNTIKEGEREVIELSD